MNIIDQLKSKYSEQVKSNDYKKKSAFNADVILFQKWAYRVEKGCYGFSLGENVPYVWARIIDEFLEYVESKYSNFKILQIKIKFGFLNINLQLNADKEVYDDEKIHWEIRALEEWLHHKGLIY